MGFKYDPALDPDYPREIDWIFGYPLMIDPATGLEWGINPETNEYYTNLPNGEWFQDDGDPLDPYYPEDFEDLEIIIPENPATPGFVYGIDPSTGELWHNIIINEEGNPDNLELDDKCAECIDFSCTLKCQ